MVSMSDELKERNILKLISIVRFACATLDVGHPILQLTSINFIRLNVSVADRVSGLRQNIP
jgi:hypothetical protein